MKSLILQPPNKEFNILLRRNPLGAGMQILPLSLLLASKLFSACLSSSRRMKFLFSPYTLVLSFIINFSPRDGDENAKAPAPRRKFKKFTNPKHWQKGEGKGKQNVI
jgi:hypothetical protein